MNALPLIAHTEHTGPVDTLAAEEVSYSTPEVCALTGLTYRQLDYWVRLGLIDPVVPAEGSGTRRRFSPEQVSALQVLARVHAALYPSGTGGDTALLGEVLAHLERGYIQRGDIILSWC